ncbi:hypothetical protein F5Y07DRAFT_399790 [Xylaria sp. FL0933]|nr:hypothetical protein F5Y07DRAFT_399790 [Xylaria sp. FL0933]
MAPKPPSKVQKSTKPSKQPRFSLQAATKKEKSSPPPSTSTEIGEEPIYSPNIDTSELSDLTEEEQNPRPIRFARIDDAVEDHGGYGTGNPFALKATIGDVGKTPRQLRAEARSRKAASSESKTTTLASQASPNAPAKGMGANGQVVPGEVSPEALEEETAQRQAAAAPEKDRTDDESIVIVAEKLDSRPRVDVKKEIKDDPFLEDDIDDVTLPPCIPLYQRIPRNQRMPPPPPSIPQLPPSIPQPPRDSPTTDIFHQYFASSAAAPNPFESVPTHNPNPFAPIQPTQPTQPAGPAGPAGPTGPTVRAWDARQAAHDPAAVARYIELLVTRPGDLRQQDDNSPLQSPSSPASPEGRIEEGYDDVDLDDFDIGGGRVFRGNYADEDEFDTRNRDDGTETQGVPGDEQMDSGAAEREFRKKVFSAEIFCGDNLGDGPFTAPLRHIARMLNFMARAQASGIEIPDFADLDTLAAVSREQWEELADAPDDAAEIVAEELLNMSFLDICLLSERAYVLRADLLRLGVHID